MNLLRIFFGHLYLPTPKAGELYELTGEESNPFKQSFYRVEVKAVKDGWVNYRFGPSYPSLQNEARKTRDFLSIYHKVKA